MIRITKPELENIVTTSNMVLVKPRGGENEIVLPNGMKLKIDISFEKNMHAPVVGTVYGVPGHLNPKKMLWDVDMELMKGDEVWYSYLAATGALDAEEGQLVECEGEIYFLIPYEDIFVAKRRTSHNQVSWWSLIVPVNGYVLIEPVEEKLPEHIVKFMINTNRDKILSERFGRVAYLSRGLVRKYNDGDGKPDSEGLKMGDYICFARAANIPCEYDLHNSLQGSKTLFRMQRRYILATIPSTLVNPI